jgi:hypothetical protein
MRGRSSITQAQDEQVVVLDLMSSSALQRDALCIVETHRREVEAPTNEACSSRGGLLDLLDGGGVLGIEPQKDWKVCRVSVGPALDESEAALQSLAAGLLVDAVLVEHLQMHTGASNAVAPCPAWLIRENSRLLTEEKTPNHG